MNSSEQRSREDVERSPQGPYSSAQLQSHVGPAHHDGPDIARPEFTLLVAGCRGGKTSFLRLLLDTSDISPSATKEQLASVAKFVQGCSSHTSYIRAASIDIDLDLKNIGPQQRLGLTLIDTPSLDFKDDAAAERLVAETLRHIDSRFAEGVEDDWKAQHGDRYVHLCIYFLDPDQIVPPSVPGPPAPLVPRARTNSFSQHDPEPVILEPPVTNNPLLFRPTLPTADINTIRRLSARVNVLPVIARADVLSNDRLAAIKMAIRRDLADAGIGFGIFDVDGYQHSPEDSSNAEPLNGYGHPNGSSSSATSPPTSPVTPLLRLPYALISPDIYSHSDGVLRKPLSRHELVQQYTPTQYSSPSKIVRGKFIRSYRWGSMDVLDPSHSDFLPLRAAIFHHMETLQKYTRDYLFDKFRVEYHLQQRPSSRHSIQHMSQGMPHMSNLTISSRPILAIDTAQHPMLGGEMRSAQVARPVPDALSSSTGSRASGSRMAKQRTKKITVACNFCRSRKLKCDGGRPACSQCVKRSNPCDYMPQNKRRGTLRQRKDDGSDSDSGEERSGDHEEPSLSPEVPSQPLSRRSSNVDKLNHDGYGPPVPPMIPINERREDPPPQPAPSTSRSKPTHAMDSHSFFMDNELPHIATLSLPEHSPSTPIPMSAPSLPPIRPASEQQAAQRKRAATVPGKTTRQPSSSGPKVVACNFCRARKTKCDGAHPACASCARRSLACNYIHDSAGGGSSQKKARRASSSKPPAGSPSPSPPSSRMVPTPSSSNEQRDRDIHLDGDVDLKRGMDHSDLSRPLKKMKMENSPLATADIP
ncbi:hypothetical protein BD779DRAFT_1660294 [Infundibulicybe gibba]|nr:hypothetical protein BD779DRAFT_1660294 [Infundibulicybe gibba]